MIAAEGARQLGASKDELEVEALVFFVHLLQDLPEPLVPLFAVVLNSSSEANTGIKQVQKSMIISLHLM